MSILATPPARTEDSFIRTYTGRKFWPLNARPEDVCIEDIAHALAQACRWTGHARWFYSVAEHSLRVSDLAQRMFLRSSRDMAQAREVALWGLLHDASEAYLCDLPTPLKRAPLFGDLYKTFEASLMEAIIAHFALLPDMPAVVKEADLILLNTEGRDLMGVEGVDAIEWRLPGRRLRGRISPLLCPNKVEAEFRNRCQALTMAREVEQLAARVEVESDVRPWLSPTPEREAAA